MRSSVVSPRWGGRAVGLIPLVGLLAVLVLGACAIPGSQRREAEQVATARVRDLARLDRQDVERAANAGQLGAAEVAEILVRSGRAIVVQKSMDDTGAVALGYLDWGQAGGGFTGVTVYARLCVELTVSSGGESAMVDADCPERITAPPGGTLVRVRLD